MIKTEWEPVAAVLNTTFDFLVVIFALVLLANKFINHSIGLYVNFGYFLAIIVTFGFSSILLRSLSGEHQERVVSLGAACPQGSFWLNWLFHVQITLLNTSLVVCGLTGVVLVWVWARRQSWISRSVSRVKLWFKPLRIR